MASVYPPILKADPLHPEPRVLAEAIRCLAEGRLVVVPTETVYGVAAHPDVPGALERLFAAKGRPDRKPVARLVPDACAVRDAAGGWSDREARLAKRFWPGPLTLVLRTAEGDVGFRVPDHPVTLALLRQLGRGLAVSSANRSDAPPAVTAAEAAKALGDSVALVLDAGRSPGGVPSTVVRLDGDELTVLREGALDRPALEKALQEPLA